MLRCQIKRQKKTNPKESYKPPSAHEKNISPSLPLRSVGVVSLITSAYTYREGGSDNGNIRRQNQ
jgi:hypothetical protein